MKKELTEEQQQRTAERRAAFKETCKAIKAKIDAGQEPPVSKGRQSNGAFNAWLIAGYEALTGETDFRTFKGWKDAGYKVKKGEQGYPIFSRPVAVIQAERGKEVTADDKYFSTCYLFHVGQVEVIKEGEK